MNAGGYLRLFFSGAAALRGLPTGAALRIFSITDGSYIPVAY
jgi:hypothetical protein